jgi:phospholipid/cholesterol/gamma-HCH transport system substrate-binding protein
MENDRHYFLVGLFVIGGALMLLLFTIWLTTRNDSDYRPYRIRFAESVSGLANGSAVKFRGVDVGHVEKIMIDPDDARLIRVDVNLLKTAPVKIDTKANLKMQGITGIVFIELSGGDPNLPNLANDDDTKHIPVIPAEPSSLNALINRVPILLDKISNAVDQINKFVSDDNAAAFSALLKGSGGAVTDLRSILDHSKSNIDDSTAEAAEAMQHLNHAAGNADELSQKLNDNPSAILFSPAPKGVPAP